MKKIFTLLAATVASLGLNAQITISQSDYGSWTPRTDSFQDLDTPITIAAASNWDLTANKYKTSSYTVAYSAFTNAGLPGATYSYNASYGFSSLFYTTAIAGGVTSNGVEEFGESVPAQSIDISALTTKSGDSLIFPAQIIPYSAARVRLSFTTSLNKTWTSSFKRTTAFTLKYGGNSYVASRIAYATQVDSVNGWGRVRIKRLDGSNSDWMDVLAVKTKVNTEDSFSMVGAPAATLNALLRGFGLKQGMRDSTHSLQLFRKGEIVPVLTINYNDTTYTSIKSATVHQSRIPANVGVNAIPAAAGLKLFPNPATAAGGFDIELTETATGVWNYNLLDASGKVVSRSVITPVGSKMHIDAAQAAPGTYFLNLQNNGQPVATKPVIIK